MTFFLPTLALFGVLGTAPHEESYVAGIAWSVRAAGSWRGTPVIDGDIVFAGAADGVYAIALHTGKLDVRTDAVRWRTATGALRDVMLVAEFAPYP